MSINGPLLWDSCFHWLRGLIFKCIIFILEAFLQEWEQGAERKSSPAIFPVYFIFSEFPLLLSIPTSPPPFQIQHFLTAGKNNMFPLPWQCTSKPWMGSEECQELQAIRQPFGKKLLQFP